jgi:hypothetical protein
MAARVQAAVEVVKNKALKVAEDTKAYAKEKTSQVTWEKLMAAISFRFFGDFHWDFGTCTYNTVAYLQTLLKQSLVSSGVLFVFLFLNDKSFLTGTAPRLGPCQAN